jgi:hypothetical protein
MAVKIKEEGGGMLKSRDTIARDGLAVWPVPVFL